MRTRITYPLLIIICVVLLFLVVIITSCGAPSKSNPTVDPVINKSQSGIQIVVLGTAQDGGSPHIGCKKNCCAHLWAKPDPARKVVSLGIIDHEEDKVFIVEASPDFPAQLAHINDVIDRPGDQMPDGVLLTHAHIGHYTGLMYLGREAKGAKNIPVFSMPEMQHFLSTNGPWDQLIQLNNIDLQPLYTGRETNLSTNLKVRPFLVPHRDEYSETVGFVFTGMSKSALFIPDIDKWAKWEEKIAEVIRTVDYAFLDATFYDGKEINNRDISEIPHPFVIESMSLFETLPAEEREKIHFIHLNHTNPLWDAESDEYKVVEDGSFRVAQYDQRIAI